MVLQLAYSDKARNCQVKTETVFTTHEWIFDTSVPLQPRQFFLFC